MLLPGGATACRFVPSPAPLAAARRRPAFVVRNDRRDYGAENGPPR